MAVTVGAAQNYPRFVVLALDDHSEDDTAREARSAGFSEEGTQFRLLHGQALPRLDGQSMGLPAVVEKESAGAGV